MDRQLLLPRVPSSRVVLPPVKVRIFTGAKLLDVKRRTPRWRADIDLARLNLEDPEHCVLGQLFDHYMAGCCELGIKHRQAVESGFHIWDPHSPEAMAEFDTLTREWRRFLRTRK